MKTQKNLENELVSAVIAFNKNEYARLDGLSYKIGVNGFSFYEAIQKFPKKHGLKQITVPISGMQDYIGNTDLDSNYHLGFTVGRGKVLYFMFIWHSSGTCTVYPTDDKKWPRNLTGNENITIYFK